MSNCCDFLLCCEVFNYLNISLVTQPPNKHTHTNIVHCDPINTQPYIRKTI